MRKTALFLAMILILNPVMSDTVRAAEDAPVYVAEDVSAGQEESDEEVQPEEGSTDAVDVAPSEHTDPAQPVQEETAGAEETAEEQPDGETAEPAADTDPAGEQTGSGQSDTDEEEAADQPAEEQPMEEEPAEEQPVEDEAAETEETDELSDGEVTFEQEHMEAAAVSYKLYEKAHETPKGYLAVLLAQAGAYAEPGKIVALTYMIDGQSYEAELVRNAGNDLRSVGFYLNKDLTSGVKTVFVRMRYTIGQGAATENTFESSQRVQLIKADKTMTYSAKDGDKTISDGHQIRIALSLYTGLFDKVQYAKVALKKTGGQEKTIVSNWTPEIQSKDNVPDPRYDADYRLASPYAEYIEGTVNSSESLQDGTYDLILYQKGGEIERHVITGYLNVTHQNAIYDGGYVSNDHIFSVDNSGTDAVTIWVYGLGLSQSTVPVLYQTISGRKRAVTSSVLGFEPLAGGKEGAVYRLAKDGFRNDLANTTIRFPDGQVFDSSNKSVIECAYHFNECVYVVDAKETSSGVLNVETHIECDAEKILIYLAEAYTAEASRVSVLIAGQMGEEIINTVADVRKDAGGRLYVELGKETTGYERIRKSASYKATLTNAGGIKTSADFKADEPGYHKDNLTVPSGCTWEICRVDMLPGHIMDGSKAGKNVLTKEQLAELQKYGTVRYKILRDNTVIQEEKAIFGAGKAAKREPTPEERVESGAKPALAVVEDSLTVTGVKIAVKTPEYTRKKPSDYYYIQLIVENVKGETETRFEKYNGKSSQVFKLTYEPTGSSYAVTARIVYSTAGVENSPYNVYGKLSKQLIVTLKDPYEKSLQISGDKVKIVQGATDLYNVAKINWKNAHERYRAITKIEVTGYPEDADVASVKRALYYSPTENMIKINTAALDWSKLPAGEYRVRAEAMQRAEKAPAGRTFVIYVRQGASELTVNTDSTRYYKVKNKTVKIKTIVQALDHTGRTMEKDKLGKLTYNLEKTVQGMQINQSNGEVTVSKEFDGEATNQVYFIYRNVRYSSPVFKVTNVKCHIGSVKVQDIPDEKLEEGSFKAYEINGKRLIVTDDNNETLPESLLKYTVGGSSVKVDKNGVIHTTGVAGKAVITVMINDGSKEKAQLDVAVVNDTVQLRAHYMSGGTIELAEASGSGYNVISLNGGNYICFDLIGSDGEQVQGGTTSYKLKAQKGLFVDYGKITEHTKRASGKYIYIPRAAEDVITLTDHAVKPAAVTSYRISVAAFDKGNDRIRVKSASACVYQTGAADTVDFEITGTAVDYTGYTAVLGFNYETCYKNEKNYKKYSQMEQYIHKTAAVETGNVVRFNIPDRENLPLGTYSMKLYLYKGNKELAPVSVRWKVSKNRKPVIEITTKKIVISKNKKTLRLRIRAKNCRSMEIVGVEAGYIGRSYFKSKFPDYFEMATNEKGQHYLVCKAENPKSIPSNDRKGVIRYHVVDLSGISHEYTTKVQVTIK